jgi:zeaxanthin glucosyltransferase
MANVLFIIADYAGHLHSTYEIARKLRARGHSITYLGSERMRPAVCFQGFTFEVAPFLQPLPSGAKLWEKPTPSSGPLENLRHNVSRIRTLRLSSKEAWENLRHVSTQVREVIRRHRPDLLVFDPFLLVYYLPFHAQGIPAVAISIFPLFDSDPWVPPYTSKLIPGQEWSSRVLIKLAWFKCYLQYAKYKSRSYLERLLIGLSARSLIKRLADELDFDLRAEWRTRSLYFDCKFKSVPELILTTEHFDFRRKKSLPPNTHYVGPCVDLERREEEFSWAGIELRQRLIFCALGTVNISGVLRDKDQFLKRILKVARKRVSYSFILAVGPAFDPASLSDVPPNVYLYAFVPQLQILKRAHLMIHHGGANSLKECIFAGVPMLVYPMRADQPGNSARVVFHRIGLRGDFKRDTALDIDSKINLLLTDPNFRLNLEQMRQHFLECQHAQKGIELIEQIIDARKRG